MRVLFIVFFIVTTAEAQTVKEFIYRKTTVNGRPEFRFIHEGDTTRFLFNPAMPGDMIVGLQTSDRKLTRIGNEKKIEVQEMNGSPMASFSYHKKSKYKVTFTNGTQYDWSTGKNDDHWFFSRQGAKVLSCKLAKVKGGYRIVETIETHSDTNLEMLELISNYVAMARIKQKSTTPWIIGVGAAAGILMAASGADSSSGAQ